MIKSWILFYLGLGTLYCRELAKGKLEKVYHQKSCKSSAIKVMLLTIIKEKTASLAVALMTIAYGTAFWPFSIEDGKILALPIPIWILIGYGILLWESQEGKSQKVTMDLAGKFMFWGPLAKRRVVLKL